MVAACLLLAALALFQPPAEPPFRVCGFLWLTGRPCPLCGMTRAFFALAKGRVLEALAFNLLSPAAFVALFAVVLGARIARWRLALAPLGIYGVLRALRVLP